MTAGFWDWSLEVYARPAVCAALLKLQDAFGLNVNILLWCCWRAQNGGAADDLSLRKAMDLTAAWSREVTGPLRAARFALKAPPRQVAAATAEALREKVKAAELGAERVEQEMLEALANQSNAFQGREALARGHETADAFGEARRSLARYADLAGAVRARGFSTLMLDDLARAVFVETEAAS